MYNFPAVHWSGEDTKPHLKIVWVITAVQPLATWNSTEVKKKKIYMYLSRKCPNWTASVTWPGQVKTIKTSLSGKIGHNKYWENIQTSWNTQESLSKISLTVLKETKTASIILNVCISTFRQLIQ